MAGIVARIRLILRLAAGLARLPRVRLGGGRAPAARGEAAQGRPAALAAALSAARSSHIRHRSSHTRALFGRRLKPSRGRVGTRGTRARGARRRLAGVDTKSGRIALWKPPPAVTISGDGALDAPDDPPPPVGARRPGSSSSSSPASPRAGSATCSRTASRCPGRTRRGRRRSSRSTSASGRPAAFSVVAQTRRRAARRRSCRRCAPPPRAPPPSCRRAGSRASRRCPTPSSPRRSSRTSSPPTRRATPTRCARPPAPCPGPTLYVSGQAAIEHDLDPVFADDLKVGELYIAIPIALLILVFVFGTLAFLVPFIFAAFTIPATLGIIWIFANFMELTTYLQNLVMLIGLGIAVDYSLLVVYRYREELRQGGSQGGRDRPDDGDGGPRGRLQRHGGRDRARADALHAAAVHARLRDRRARDPARLGRVRADAAAGAALLARGAARPRAPDPAPRRRAARLRSQRVVPARAPIMRRPALFAAGTTALLLALAAPVLALELGPGLERRRPAGPRGRPGAEHRRRRGRRGRARAVGDRRRHGPRGRRRRPRRGGRGRQARRGPRGRPGGRLRPLRRDARSTSTRPAAT